MPIACRTVISALTDCDEGARCWLTRTGVRLHLSVCGDCHRYVEQAKALRASLGSLAKEAVSARTKEQLMERFRAWRATRPKGDS